MAARMAMVTTVSDMMHLDEMTLGLRAELGVVQRGKLFESGPWSEGMVAQRR